MAEEEMKPVVSKPENNKQELEKVNEQELEKVNEQELEKVDEGPKRFIEHGPWVILDTETGLYWLKKDSWQEKGKFFNWHEGKEYTERKNVRNIGGFSDWRLPTIEEAATLYDESLTNVAKGGVTIHIDPVFPEGSFKVEWSVSNTSTRRPRFNYADGKVIHVDEYTFGSARGVRKEPVKKDLSKPRRR